VIQATDKEPESAELRIDGEIVDDDDMWIMEWFGIKAPAPNAFRDELKKLNGKPLTVWINSQGGSVFAASGMYNSLKEYSGEVTVKTEKAMSAATLPMMAAAKGKLMVSPSAILMFHNPLCEVYGYASDLRKTADVLDEVKKCIMNAYMLRTGKTAKEISDMMDAETYMSAATAINEGFADAMLYGDVKSVEMMFDRKKLSSSDTDAMKRMVALYKPSEPPDDTAVLRAKLALECEL